MKKCPYCAEDIQDEAVKCRHCKEMLMSTATKPKKLTWLWWTLGIIFALVLISLMSKSTNTPTSLESKSNVSVKNDEPENLVKSKVSVRAMTSRVYQMLEKIEIPKPGYLYQLSGMRAIQKVNDGYLMLMDGGEPDDMQPIILHTKRDIPRDFMLRDGWAYYVGDVEYTTISGYPKKVYAFKLYEKEPVYIGPYPH